MDAFIGMNTTVVTLAKASLEAYLNYSIEKALASTNELTRAFAMFDKRVGKRRLHSFVDEMTSAPLLVRHFYAIRCHAEGIESDCHAL
jgi:hypothetical protein